MTKRFDDSSLCLVCLVSATSLIGLLIDRQVIKNAGDHDNSTSRYTQAQNVCVLVTKYWFKIYIYWLIKKEGVLSQGFSSTAHTTLTFLYSISLFLVFQLSLSFFLKLHFFLLLFAFFLYCDSFFLFSFSEKNRKAQSVRVCWGWMNVLYTLQRVHLYDAQIKILAIRELFMQFALTEHPLEKLETWILALQVLSF